MRYRGYVRWDFDPKKEVRVRKCEFCGESFEPTKPERSVQRFCCPEHRKAWHYRDRKDEQYRAEVEAAEDRRQDRLNGLDGHGASTPAPKIDLVALGITPKLTLKRRVI
jgi:hypothetical protein